MNRTSGGDLAKEHPCGEIENMGYVSIDQPLDLKLSLTMGQAFRWQSKNDGWYSGVFRGKLFHVKETAGGIDYRVGGSGGVEVANTQWDGPLRSYFRLDTDDIESIYADLRVRQDALIPALERYRGMRVLRQEPWECLVSYLCSAPASVERISQDMETLAGEYGERVTLDGDARYTFPGPEVLAGANESSLRRLGLGFKAPRIIAAARLVSRNEGELDRLRAVPYQDAKNRLMEYPGIGPKVADCICLMALDKLEAFPIDRHIRRAAIDIAGSKMTDAAMVRWAQQHLLRAIPPLWPLKNSQSERPAALAIAFTRRAIYDSDSPNTSSSPAWRWGLASCRPRPFKEARTPWSGPGDSWPANSWTLAMALVARRMVAMLAP